MSVQAVSRLPRSFPAARVAVLALAAALGLAGAAPGASGPSGAEASPARAPSQSPPRAAPADLDQAGPMPKVTFGDPVTTYIGGSATFAVAFENVGGATGYAPFVDLVLDAHGADGNAAKEKCDGLDFAGATYGAGGAPPITVAMNEGGGDWCTIPGTTTYAHPLTGGTVTVPLGYQVISIPLPLGSFDPSEPAFLLTVSVTVSNYADDGYPLAVYARGGFRYGAQPTGGTPITSHGDVAAGWASTTVTPMILCVEKEYLGPEDENATGASFTPFYPLRYKITVTVAPGQTVTNLVIRDKLANNQAFVGIDQAKSSPYTSVNGPGTTPGNNAILEVTYAQASGAIVLEYEFFTPQVDANGNPVLNATTCAIALSINDVRVSALWDPLDPRDDPKPISVDEKPDDHTLQDKCGAIQKSVKQITDQGVAGPTPADILEYTLAFQVSDFMAMGDIRIEDWLATGQDLITQNSPPRLEISDRTHPAVLVLEFQPDTEPLVVQPDAGQTCGGIYPDIEKPYTIQGVTKIVFDVSKRLKAANPTGSNSLNAGILVGALGTKIPGQGKIVFRARVRNDYTVPQTPGNLNVDKHDPICNQVMLHAKRAVDDEMPGVFQLTTTPIEDGSKTTLLVPGDKLAKAVYARNGVVGGWKTGTSGLPQFAADDVITFQVEKTDLVGDGEHVRIQDWLPKPVLTVAGMAGGAVPLCTGAAPPAENTACYYASPSQMGITIPYPTLSASAGANQITVNFGHLQTNLAQKHTLGVRYSLRITKAAYKDGLHLTNLVRECERNTLGVTYCQVAIAEFEITGPVLKITKGLVWGGNEETEFVPKPAKPPVPFNAPPACPGFNPNKITSGAQIDYDMNYVDANDKVKYVVVVENVGNGVNGAFDVKIGDVFPAWGAGGAVVSGIGGACVSYGDGTYIPPADYDLKGVPSGISALVGTDTGFTLELTKDGVLGALPPQDPAKPGANVLVISFDLTVRSDVAIGCYANRAKILGYAGTDQGDSYIAAGHEPYNDATLCVLPKAQKSILNTSEAHTAPNVADGVPPGGIQAAVPNLAIGEIVHYHLRAYVPEGKHPAFKLVDTLPADLVPLGSFPADIQVATGGLVTAPPAVSGGPWACGVPLMPMVVDLGTVTNVGPGPKPVTVDFWALVCNTSQNGDDNPAVSDKVNRLDVVADGTVRATVQVMAKVVEPRVAIKKSIVTKTLPLAVGQSIEYKIDVTNTSTTTAFDLSVQDSIPGCLKNVVFKPAAVPLIPSVPPAVITYMPFPPDFFFVKISQLAPGQTAVVGYALTVACLKCAKLDNVAGLRWTGLPGKGTPKGTPGNSTPWTTPGVSGAYNGERNDKAKGSLNDYLDIAGAAICGKVCGWKYHDVDKDGVFDSHEFGPNGILEIGLNGWQIGATGGSGNTTVGKAVTADKPAAGPADPDAGKPGWYCIQALPGTINLSETIKPGWAPTKPAGGKQTVSVGFGETKTDVNFGNFNLSQCKATICGVKRVDGAPKAGWVIEARKPDGTLVATATTDNDGKYCLTLDGTSQFVISEVPQAGFVQTAPAAPGTYYAFVTECSAPTPFAVVWPASTGTSPGAATTVDPQKVDFGNKPTAYCENRDGWIDALGPIVAWGWNGPASFTDIGGIPATSSPVIVPGSFKAVATAPTYTMALDQSDKIHVWGPDRVVKNAPAGADFVAIAAGNEFGLALHADGTIESWGTSNGSALPGSGIAGACSDGVLLNDPWDTKCSTKLTGLPKFQAVAAGWGHSLALAVNGALYSWGNNGSLALPGCTLIPTTNTCVLAKPPNSTTDFRQIAGGADFSLAADHEGNVYGWGSNSSFQLPGTTSTADKFGVEIGAKIERVAGGVRHSLGRDWTLGSQFLGLRAWGVPTDPNLVGLAAVKASASNSWGFERVAAGYDHSMALDWYQKLHGWGHPLWSPMPPLTSYPSFRYGAIAASGEGAGNTPAATAHGVAIGCQEPCGTVCGTKYWDANGNGTREAGELPLAGWKVQLKDGASKVLASATTDGNGRYCLALPYSAMMTKYTVSEVIPNWIGWTQTGPNKNGTYTVSDNCMKGKGAVICITGIVASCGKVSPAALDFGNRFELPKPDSWWQGMVAPVAPVSSALPSWPAARLVDGDEATVWSSQGHGEHLAWSEWAAVRLDAPAAISRIRVIPRSDPSNPGTSIGFPKDFVLQYSVEGGGKTCNPADPRFAAAGNWSPLVTKYGFPQPSDGPIDFEFDVRVAGCVRLFGAELSQDDYGNRYLQIGEIEVRDDLGRHVPAQAAVSSAIGSWPAARLVDGKPETVWSSQPHGEHLAWSEWAAVRLSAASQIGRVRVIPRSDPSNPGTSIGFPKDFVLQYSLEGGGKTCNPADPRFAAAGNWSPLVTKYGFPQPADGPVDFEFAPRLAGCVRLFGAELSQDDYGNRYLQLGGIDVEDAGGNTIPAEAVVSSALPSWPAARLVDGKPETVWSSGNHGEHLAWSEWAAARLAAPGEISRVRIVPRSDPSNPGTSIGFPKDFVLQYSLEGGGKTCNPADPRFAAAGNWSPLVTKYGFPQPADGPVDFEFAPRQAGCVRVFGAELSQDDYGNRYMQVGEIEISSQVHLP